MRILPAILFVLSGSAFAQTYKPFKVGVGFGPVVSISGRFAAGFLMYVEPSYRINDNFAMGIRIETVGSSGEIGVIGSYSLSTQYYFSAARKVRFFTGAGTGLYTMDRAPLATCTCEGQSGENVWGFYPRLGLEDGHFNLMLEYNFIQSVQRKSVSDPTAKLISYHDVMPGYFSLKLGWTIGGGTISGNVN